ncbi:MAG: competence/damage-inducible protein A [Candidatus Marinimicrobia bacterium]|nr:competence/damage-inducible protein A [Candidatus Neomarinimicrobiota bacterium]|tara:strand:- start:135 stop:1355 length:1221 start_codon:yes stop_codon:yes gene_type:complete
MNVVILSIGNEVLSGQTINTNASWLGKTLTSLGCNIRKQITVPDEHLSIKKSLKFIINTNPDLLITTGGLGPTDDDITREVIFDFVGTDFEFDEDYWNKLKHRFENSGMKIPESNRSQALIPKDGNMIPNSIGSASGYWFVINSTELIVLPGVTNEMKSMMNESIVPYIKEKSVTIPNIQLLRTTGIPESSLIEKIKQPISKEHNCTIGYYPSYYGVDIRLTGYDKESIIMLSDNISDILGYFIYAKNNIDIAEVIVRLCISKELTIATAESCTGGLIGHRITQISGSSKVYIGGIVAYNNKIKEDELGIQSSTLKNYGAVSAETAEEMAKNISSKFKADIGLSVTGIAGPVGGTIEKPVGLVYIALAFRGTTNIKKIQFEGNRITNKKRTSQASLNFLRLALINE